MRTAMICHHDNPINRHGLTRWLGSFSDLAGIVVISETAGRRWQRTRAEWHRSRWRMLDVLAYHVWSRIAVARRDAAWVHRQVAELQSRYPPVAPDVPIHRTSDPNDESTRSFLQRITPDVVLARCKTLLRPALFEVPTAGTFVLHPGICPEYRNAHGCFWALARRDLARVGATLLRIDQGIDTGPIFAYYRTDINERVETPLMIQHRVVLDNLDAVAADLAAAADGRAQPLVTAGRPSAIWGQPRLSDLITWKRAARREGR